VDVEAQAPFDRFARILEEFERTVLAQRPLDASHYEAEYFAEAWRAEGNRYDLDTRRAIEGRHPELIREVLEPQRVLDVGCGPGFLMQFLHELGVDVSGVDFSPAVLDLAPPAMRERIAIAPVEALGVPDRSHDLVICREVLEHLTVLQVRRAVGELCRASSRLVYVTTRFHPAPESLLDVTTDVETDPTHITLLAKDFLRALLVLEGFRSRADLEQRLDWAGKGRVLVYERCG
jgi:2-polyprenyl-3-methyl-5-hydroxy-6-metoxy-1,4-benzoquinol methylase